MTHDPTTFTGNEVVETADFVLFWKPPAPFGQWTPSRFELDGVVYSCAEQYMMAAKARLFGDETTCAAIIASDSPHAHKALGRQVRRFNQLTWDAARYQIVVTGNLAKFSQNPEMGVQLLATGHKTLVEASPLDRIWGIGLRADHPSATRPEKWRGLNLLGKALMDVRETMRAQSTT